MFCSKCGAWAPKDAKFCAYCGDEFAVQNKPVEETAALTEEAADVVPETSCPETEATDVVFEVQPTEETDICPEETVQPAEPEDLPSAEGQDDLNQNPCGSENREPNAEETNVVSLLNELSFGEEDAEFELPLEDKTADKKTKPIGVLGFLLAMLVSAVPVVGFIVMTVWAAGGAKNRNRVHFAVADLIIRVFLFMIFLGACAYVIFFAPELKDMIVNAVFELLH